MVKREVARSILRIHASPPCQAYSSLRATYGDHVEHSDLVSATRERLGGSGAPWVIENVVGAPLENPIMLCGSSFGLDVRRHRLFETSFPVMAMPCAHHWQKPKFDVYEHGRWIKSPVARVYGRGGGKAEAHWAEAMDIDWMDRHELAQAIPPAFTEFIGHQLMSHIEKKAA